MSRTILARAAGALVLCAALASPALTRPRTWRAAANAVSAVGLPHLDYRGGQILDHVQVVPVLWGPNVFSDAKTQLGPFYQGLVQSPLYDFLGEYSTASQTMGTGTTAAVVTITPQNKSTTISDTNVAAEIIAQIAAGGLPAPGDQTIYMVHFPPGVQLALGTARDCSAPQGQFCAYHSGGAYQGKVFYFGAMADLSTGSCAQECGSSQLPIENLTATASHEYTEAITDPSDNDTWFDNQASDAVSAHAEIGDICANILDDEAPFTTGSGTFRLQREWSNQYSGCIISKDDTYSITFTPSAPTVRSGGSVQVNVATGVPVNGGQDVQIFVLGIPTGTAITASASPFLVRPGNSTQLTLSAGASVAAGTYQLELLFFGQKATLFRTLPLTVVSDDFSLALSPASATIAAGQSATITVNTTTAAGSSPAALDLRADGLPPGVQASFSPPSITSGQSSQLTLTALTGAPSASGVSFTVSGVASTVSRSATGSASLTGGDDFTVSLASSSLSVAAGSSTKVDVKTTSSGTARSLTLSAQNLPQGVVAVFTPDVISAGQTATLTLAAQSGQAAESGNFTINAAGPYSTASVQAAVKVTGGGGGGCSSTGEAPAWAILLAAFFGASLLRKKRALALLALCALVPAAARAQATSQPLAQYVGGPVLSQVKVYAVFWGPNVDATVKSSIGSFFTAAVASPLVDWLAEYDTNITSIDGATGTNQTIGRGSFVSAITITPANTSSAILTHDIEVELVGQVKAGHLPTPDANTYFVVYLPGSVSLEGNDQTCANLCGTHRSYLQDNVLVYYGVVPDCARVCGGASANAFDNFTALSWFEVFRGIVDPHRVLGYSAAPRGWVDTAFGDIGLACDGNDKGGTFVGGDGVTYAVHKGWSNTASACIVDRADAFSATLTPSSASTGAGASIQMTVNVSATGAGPAQPVTLDTTALPAGVSVSFSPAQVTTGQSSTMTVTLGGSPPAQFNFSVRVHGKNTVAYAHAVVSTQLIDFAGALTPSKLTLAAGAQATLAVSATATAGPAAQPIALAAPGLPPGVTAAFSPASFNTGASATVTLTAAADAPSSSGPIGIALTSAGTTHTLTSFLTVTGADFTLSLEKAAVSVPPGGKATLKVATAQVSGSAESLALAIKDLPTGVTAAFDPASVTAGGSSTLTLTAAAGTPANIAAATVTAGSATNLQSAQLAINVGASRGGGCATGGAGSAAFAALGLALAALLARRKNK